MNILNKSLVTNICSLFLLTMLPMQASAFCGFYVAKADTSLFNKASKVVLVRDEQKTVVTMSSDYEGDAKDFAIVVPVPEVLQKGQINVTNNKIIDHLDAYTAPRLVEYHDSDPCAVRLLRMEASAMMSDSVNIKKASARAKAKGVTIEANYTVGEYDILILSAKESNGLQSWLDEEGYKVPQKARRVLGSYLKQGMKFFVAKVNLEERDKTGLSYLRPIQMAFESEKFMLPIRLGTVNAKGSQDMFVFALTKKGRVETTNYRTVKIPSNMDVPLFVKDDFDSFYTKMFDVQLKKERNKAVFLEYAWDMSWCDPCAADPLSHDELRELGVFWLNNSVPPKPMPMVRSRVMPQAANVYVTRLHVRYDAENFPEDLMLQTTSNRKNFQGRYIMRHPWKGKSVCPEAENYYANLIKRFDTEAGTVANLTGWSYADVKQRMKDAGQNPANFRYKKIKTKDNDKPWWQGLWKRSS